MAILLSQSHMGTAWNISFGQGWGTAFLLFDATGSFYVTAKHVVHNAFAGSNIEFRGDPNNSYMAVQEIVHSPNLDLTVFTSQHFSFSAQPQTPCATNMLPGEELRFLGFPHGLANSYPSPMGLCTPLVRSAHFSGVLPIQGQPTLILDGFNNPGYSGGPVYAANPGAHIGFVGMINGYRHERTDHSKLYKKANGMETEVQDHYVKANSGMIYATKAFDVFALAQNLATRNP